MLGFGTLGQLALGQSSDDAAAFALAISAGSFTLTGQDVTFGGARKIFADVGAFTFTGNAAGVQPARKIVSSAGSFTLTGFDAAVTAVRRLDATSIGTGYATQFGFEPLGEVALGQGEIEARVTFQMSLEQTGLVTTRTITASVGTFTFGGQSAELIEFLGIHADAGDLSIGGHDAALRVSRYLSAATGTFALGNNVINFVRRSRLINVRPGGGTVGLRSAGGGGVKGLRVRA